MNKDFFHILIVDDDDRIRDLVKQYLEENKFLVTTARDAIDAKEKLKVIKFDILILDIMMPGESGLDLTKEIKKKDSVPIILCDLYTEFTPPKPVSTLNAFSSSTLDTEESFLLDEPYSNGFLGP